MRVLGLAGILLWLALAVTGFMVIVRFENTPAHPGDPASDWPASGALDLAPNGWRLVVAIHPRCSCSSATLDELTELLARCPTRLRTVVLLWRPRDGGDAWEDTAVARRVRAIAGVEVVADEDGVEAQRFGMQTSGHVSLYDGLGVLRFSGGITNSRGHAGDSIGRTAILAELAGKRDGQRATPVYGCSLQGR